MPLEEASGRTFSMNTVEERGDNSKDANGVLLYKIYDFYEVNNLVDYNFTLCLHLLGCIINIESEVLAKSLFNVEKILISPYPF